MFPKFARLNLFRENIDKAAVLILWLCLALSAFWPPFKPVLEWDVFGYYLYIPAFFFHSDPALYDFSWVQHVQNNYNPTATFYQGVKLDDGGFVMRYPIGLAVLNLPFMLLADWSAALLSIPDDGFTLPYQVGWVAGSLAWSLLGLLALRWFLRQYAEPEFTALAILTVGFGTNYFQLAGMSAALPHAFLFSLYAILLFLTIKWHQSQKRLTGLGLGFTIGLIAITRPNEVLVGIIPLIWGVQGWQSFKERVAWLWERRLSVLVVLSGFIIGLLPQLLYWKWRTGQWLYWSYQDPAVGFDLTRPHTIPFLFSFRKGWFIYTPLAVLLLISLFSALRRYGGYALPVLVFFLLHLYISSSWTCWWYAGGSFSSRSMVPVYALLIMPFGVFLQKVFTGNKWQTAILSLVVSALVALNLFQTGQFRRGILDGERMTKAYYFRIFGKMTVDVQDRNLLLPERPTTSIENMPENLKSRTPDNTILLTASEGDILTAENPFSRTIELSHRKLLGKRDYAWLRAEAVIDCENAADAPLLVVSYHYKEAAYKYRTTEYRNDSLQCPGTNSLLMEYMTPEARSDDDKLKVYLWYRGRDTARWSAIRLQIFYPR